MASAELSNTAGVGVGVGVGTGTTATLPSTTPSALPLPLPTPSSPISISSDTDTDRIWYLAYGSNMSAAKFTGSRGIVPAATAVVRVPGWQLVFDVPGLPYSEPGFASVAPRRSSRRHNHYRCRCRCRFRCRSEAEMKLHAKSRLRRGLPASDLQASDLEDSAGEEGPQLELGVSEEKGVGPSTAAPAGPGCWCCTERGKPALNSGAASRRAGAGSSHDGRNPSVPPDVLGVAYLITPAQYRRVLASEGGGIMYADIALRAERVDTSSTSSPAIAHPSAAAAAAATVGARALAQFRGETPQSQQQLFVRTLQTVSCMRRSPHAPSNQPRPSARYMELLTTGAAEASMPDEYQAYLRAIPRYVPPTSGRAKVGAVLFLAVFGRLLGLMEWITNASMREDGSVPVVVKWLVRGVVLLIWIVHDGVFARIVGRGDGVGDQDGEGHGEGDEGERWGSSGWEAEGQGVDEKQPLLAGGGGEKICYLV